MPILLKRYRLVELIANGTFSQIFKAVDLFLQRAVAVKVMRIGYSLLGRKEVALLQFIALKTLVGCKYCKWTRRMIY